MVKNGKPAATESKTDDAKTGSTPVPAATPAYEPQLRDRKITDEQRARFLVALRDAPHGRVFVSAVKGDREAYLYAEKIDSMLRQAGFGSDDAPVTFLSETEGPQNFPVMLFISDKPPIRPHVLAIQNALELIGIRCDLAYREIPGPPGDLHIAVYPQPYGELHF